MASEKSKLTKDQIFEILFDRIYNGTYKPGYKLTEQVFAAEFNTSRTPIREILHRLARLRLVSLAPNKGAEVLGLSCDDVEEMYDMRRVLELLALESAISHMRLQDLGDLRGKAQGITAQTDLKTVSKIDYAIHNYIIKTSHRPRLAEALEQLLLLILRHAAFPDPKSEERAAREHLELIDALFLRDLEKAKRILSDHLDNSKKAALFYLFHKTSD